MASNISTTPSIEIALKPGSRVSILTDVNMDDGGFTASTVFEDVVTQYVPTTAKLEFEDSNIGLPEFESLLEEHDSVQVVRE